LTLTINLIYGHDIKPSQRVSLQYYADNINEVFDFHSIAQRTIQTTVPNCHYELAENKTSVIRKTMAKMLCWHVKVCAVISN
jgi:hypothetical protein